MAMDQLLPCIIEGLEMNCSTLLQHRAINLLAIAIGIFLPTVTYGSAYSYMYYEITDLVIEGEYQSSVGGNEWAQPASLNLPSGWGTLTAINETIAPPITPTTKAESLIFNYHVPPPGPLQMPDPAQAFINIGGSSAPLENTFTPLGMGGGNFSRADSETSLHPPGQAVVGAFGNPESPGVDARVVSESFIAGGSVGALTAAANAVTTVGWEGLYDMNDLSLDSDADISPPAPIKWTEQFRVSFNYEFMYDLATTTAGDSAAIDYEIILDIVEIDGMGVPIPNGASKTLLDNLPPPLPMTDLVDSKSVAGAATLSGGSSGAVSAIYDLSAANTGLFRIKFVLDPEARINTPSGVPTPATTVLMLIGLLGIGTKLGRRNRQMAGGQANRRQAVILTTV